MAPLNRNSDIDEAAGAKRVFVVDPSLEGCLGIDRSASDKPPRVAEELEDRKLDDSPKPLVGAVKALSAEPKQSENGSFWEDRQVIMGATQQSQGG